MCQINAKCVKSRSAKCVKLTSSAKCVKNINAKCVKLTRSANMWKWLTENVETKVIGWISLKLNFLCNSIRACVKLTSSAKCVKNINAKCVKLTRSANMWKWLTENVETKVIGWISLKLNFLCNSIRACAILRVRVIFSCPATSPLFSHFANEKIST